MKRMRRMNGMERMKRMERTKRMERMERIRRMSRMDRMTHMERARRMLSKVREQSNFVSTSMCEHGPGVKGELLKVKSTLQSALTHGRM